MAQAPGPLGLATGDEAGGGAAGGGGGGRRGGGRRGGGCEPRGQRRDPRVADREHHPARRVQGDDDRRARQRGHHPGQGRADHQAQLIRQPEHRVSRDPLAGREQVRDQRVLAGHAPRTEQRRYAEQGDVTGGVEAPGQRQAADQPEGGGPQHGVHEYQPRPPATAQPAPQRHRADRPRQRVGRHGGADQQPAAALRGQLQGQPGDRHRAHPVAQRGGGRTREDPAKHRVTESGVVRRRPSPFGQPEGPGRRGRHRPGLASGLVFLRIGGHPGIMQPQPRLRSSHRGRRPVPSLSWDTGWDR